MASLISKAAQWLYPLRRKLIKLFNTGVVFSGMPFSKTTGKSVYDFKIPGIESGEIDFSRFRGKKMLLVNTASECGYTPQYASLQQLHEQYGDRLVVIGFPSNDFGAQEPGSEKEILEFCRQNYDVTFPLTKKIHVTGEQQHEIFRWLTHADQNGWNGREPNWNFCKYLVDEAGNLKYFFSHKMDPLDPELTSKI